jgi:preprotein translocase subunit SecA
MTTTAVPNSTRRPAQPLVVDGAARQQALRAASEAASQALKRTPYATQIEAAHAMLDGHLVEQATGEGKSLAVALAAAVAAQAGRCVHVMTANDYLAQRDASLHAPLFAALQLTVSHVSRACPEHARRAAYRADITYATVRELAFDTLRDRSDHPNATSPLTQSAQRLAGAPGAQAPRIARHEVALLDEADSLLLDEAALPLVIAEALDDPQQRATAYQALWLAHSLDPSLHATRADSGSSVALNAAGEALVADHAATLGGHWLHPQHRRVWVDMALHALYGLHRDHDYVVVDGAVNLVDRVTGRRDAGRTWARGLQTLVALKEGLAPPASTRTVARTHVAAYLANYARLAGTSGSLWDVRRVLWREYRRHVVAISPRRPCQRQQAPTRFFQHAAQRQAAVVERVAQMHSLGRPVLIGTRSVDDSQTLGQALVEHGLSVRVLNALHDADEAAIVAQAGELGAITVATRMAGRGTDIAVHPEALARGGLHVINMQDNRLARLDRQLAGRCARQGEAGSVETWRVAPYRWAQGPLASTWLPAAVAWSQAAAERKAARERNRTHGESERWDG